MKNQLIILDRDGVINYDSPDYIKSPEEWQPIPGSLEAIACLTEAGFTIAVATNQSGIARGLYTHDILQKIHEKMLDAVAAAGGRIDKIFYCPHAAHDECDCRKPKSGLFKQISQYYQTSLKNVPAVGDKISDMQAANALDCRLFLVASDMYSQKNIASDLQDKITFCHDLADVVSVLLDPKKQISSNIFRY